MSVVARDEPRRDDTEAVLRDVRPRRARDDERVAALSRVRGCDDRAAVRPPVLDHARDGRGGEVGPVRHEDDRRLDVVVQRAEPAAKRRSGPALPVRAADEPDTGVQRDVTKVVRAFDHDDLVHRAFRDPREHAGEEESLLGSAEPRRGAGGEHDRGDPAHRAQLDDAVTDSTTIGWSGCSVAGSPSEPISSTTSRPSVTSPTIA